MQKIKFEYRITIGYLIIGCIWIVFSDKILNYLIRDPDLLTRFQTYKGWFYVIITAVLFYLILKRHLVRLRNAEHKAKESDRLKTAFIQNISHEIRTPMNSIIGFTELLKDNGLSEEQKREFIGIITVSSNQLLNIVNEVLDISLIETGNILINLKRVQINHLLDELISFFKPLIKKDIAFSVTKGLKDQQSYVLTDEVKIRHILTNLLNNAIKFTDSGHITFGYNLVNNELEFFIEDSGIGIPGPMQESVFDRFRKADTENSKFYEGVGLGLSICKGNVVLLNGRIWMKSVEGKGSTFFFTIPYNQTDTSETSAGVIPVNRDSLNELRVLIVEDDKTNYLYISNILKEAGIDFIQKGNGKDAVDICRSDRRIKIVLMDIKMPEMNGYDAAKAIKQFRSDIHIIAQTAYALSDERERAISSGCDDYIAKPFKREQLLEIISKHNLP